MRDSRVRPAPRVLACTAGALFFLAPACAAQTGDRNAGWRGDIDNFLAEAARQHYVYASQVLPPAMTQGAEELKALVPRFGDQRMLVELQRLAVHLGDGHSYCAPFGARRVQATWLPLRFHLFQDGLFVIDAPEEYGRWIGRRVESIGGVPVDRLLVELERWVSRDNDIGIRWIGPFLLRFRGLLEAVTERLNGGRVAVGLVGADQRRETARIPFVPVPALRGGVPKLIASRLPDAPPAPLYLQNVTAAFWLQELREDEAVYVQVNQMLDGPTESLAGFAQRLGTLLRERGPRLLILDLRHNNGGDESSTWPLLETLEHFEASRPEARIVVITGPNTFSAAQVFIARVDQRTRALFAGEPSSSRPNFVGEENAVVLPWSGAFCSISNREHRSVPGDTRSWIEPDIPVSLSSTQYFANRDPVLSELLRIRR